VFLGLDELNLLAITVATDETDGYKRFMRSAKSNNIDVKVSLIIHTFIEIDLDQLRKLADELIIFIDTQVYLNYLLVSG